MNSEALQNLPPEMQQRIASIVAQSAQMPTAPAQPTAIAPPPVPPKAPSLMDHLIALRQEVDALRQENRALIEQIGANSNVVEAVGQAVGQMYQMFQTTPNQAATYSASFQNQPVEQDGADY